MIQKILSVLGIVLVFGLALTACTMAQNPGLDTSTLSADPVRSPIDYDSWVDVDNARKITVTGRAEISATPDEAWVIVGVETTHTTAKGAQKENAERMDAIIKALKAAGVDKDDIETQNYYLNKNRRWNRNTNDYDDLGYRVTNDIKFKAPDINNVGKYIDIAVDAGANQARNVQFTLSKKAKEEMSVDLLTQAAQTGKMKAIILAEALDARVGRILVISESNFNVQPVYRAVPEMAMMAADSEVDTPIMPGEIKTNAMVSLTFELI